MENNHIFQSRISERKFASYHNIIEKSRSGRWVILLATFLSYFILPGLLFSYGVIFITRIEDGTSPWLALLPATLFCVTWTLADPWCRDAVDSWGSALGSRQLAAAGVLLAFTGVASSAFIKTPFTFALCYGVFTGLGTSLVISQVNFVISEVFQTDLIRIQNVSNYGQAMGQCVIPYIIILLLDHYGTQMGLLVTSCLVIQILPAIMSLKTDELSKPAGTYKDYSKSYSLFSDDTSLPSISHDIQLVDLSKKSWKDTSFEILNNSKEEPETEQENNEYFNRVEAYDEQSKTLIGVKILPQILEESDEDSVDIAMSNNIAESCENWNDRAQNSNDVKKHKLVAIVKPQQMHINDKNINIITENDNILRNNTENNDIIYDSIHKEERNDNWIDSEHFHPISNNLFSSFTHSYSSSYKWHRVKRKTINTVEYVKEAFIDPFVLSVRTWSFYPALLLKICSLSIPAFASSFTVMAAKSSMAEAPMHKIVFLLLVHGITWIIFLIVYHWLRGVHKSESKYLASGGCFISALGLFVITESVKFEFLALGSSILGFGFGAISSQNEDALRKKIGAQKWPKIRGTLETLSAFMIIILSIPIGYLLTKNNGLQECFGLLIWLLLICGYVWIAMPIAMAIRKYQSSQPLSPLV